MTEAPATGSRDEATGAPAAELARLRERHAFEASPASSFALAKGLWQNGLYDEALAQFTATRDLAPQAPDAGISLIRAAIMLGRLDEARAAVEHALRHDPDLPLLRVHQAQLLASEDPAAARDLLAPHRDTDALAHLFHNALDDIANAREAADQAFGLASADAMWAGHVWLSRRQPRPKFAGTPPEVLRLAIAWASLDGPILECSVHFGRSLPLLAQWSGQRCHGFESAQGFREQPAALGAAADIELHPGDFEDTLPAFFEKERQPIRLLHVDCDLYGPTKTVLDTARPWLREGGVIVFDDFIGYPDSEEHGFRAFAEFAEEQDLRWTVLAGAVLGREVALRIDGFDR